jgi:hypothetical protein
MALLVIKKLTLILASKRLNMGAFFSISGIIINLQKNDDGSRRKKKDIRPQQMNKKTALKIGALSSLPYSAAPDKDVLELRHLPILQIH